MVRWRIYYGDRTTFSDLEGPPENAPCTNVTVIAYYDADNRRRLCHGNDYYWFDAYWHGGDLFGLWDYLARPGAKVVKFGRSIGDLAWRKIMSKADHDLPLEGAA